MSIDTSADCIEQMLPNVLTHCAGKWVFRADDDEVVSAHLAAWLPTAVEHTTKRIIAVPRRAVRFLDEDSLVFATSIPNQSEHDFQYRGFLREGVQLHALVHTAGIHVDPSEVLYAPADCCLYHFDWVVRTHPERAEKLMSYQRLDSSCWERFKHQYLPEDFHDDIYSYMPVSDASIVRLAQTLRRAKQTYDDAVSRFSSRLEEPPRSSDFVEAWAAV